MADPRKSDNAGSWSHHPVQLRLMNSIAALTWREVSAGDLTARSGVEGRDEIGGDPVIGTAIAQVGPDPGAVDVDEGQRRGNVVGSV